MLLAGSYETKTEEDDGVIKTSFADVMHGERGRERGREIFVCGPRLALHMLNEKIK